MNTFPYLSDKEYVEIKNVDGVYLAHFKGEIIPCQMETKIEQGVVNEFGNYETYATIKFLVKPEALNSNTTVTITGDKLIGIIKNNDSDRNNLI